MIGEMMMYAIFQSGGHQHKAVPQAVVILQKLDAEVGEQISFDQVLMVHSNGEVQVGTPHVAGAQVTGTVVQQGRGPKIRVFKYKPKINYKRQYGHRQSFTAVRIDEIKA